MRAISVADAVAMIPDGAYVMIGGFMGTGTPERLLDAVGLLPVLTLPVGLIEL